MKNYLSNSRLNLATNSLDWVMGHTIKQSLSLKDAVPLDGIQQLAVPENRLRPYTFTFLFVIHCVDFARSTKLSLMKASLKLILKP